MTLNEFLLDWHSPSPTLLVHTSGSTGKPKPMLVEKRRMLASARITCDFLGLHSGDSALLCMPLDYIAGKMVVVRSIERVLRLIAVKPCGHPLSDEALSNCHPLSDGALHDGEEVQIDFAAMVPMQVFNSLQVPRERERLRHIRQLIIGGGAIDDTLQRELKSFPNAVWSTYGMTETLSHIALRRLSGKDVSEWYTPFDTVTVSLNADGCLVIDAPLVHDGPLVTNDRAELRGGRFRILGRKDNVIDSGGIKIQIEEVEQLLRKHLAKPFIITKTADKKFGEAVALLTEATDIEPVRAICREVLPKYWQPRHIHHIENIPLTATGKPARAEAERLANAL